MMLKTLREQMDKINRELIDLLGRRLEVAKEIARVKKRDQLPILDAEREKCIQEEVKSLAKERGLNTPMLEEIFTLIFDHTRMEMERTE